jgi:putative Mn2+ efflux pump MntP
MDAFAVAICKGLAMARADWRKAGTVGAYFGVFQSLMPLLGYLLGAQFADKIVAYDHWVAFILLAIIGGRMIKEGVSHHDKPVASAPDLGFGAMLPLAVATSIDAMAVGISFAFLNVSILPAVLFIGATTFTLSAAGVKIGNLFGARYKSGAEVAGGVILILIGLKILLEHLHIL